MSLSILKESYVVILSVCEYAWSYAAKLLLLFLCSHISCWQLYFFTCSVDALFFMESFKLCLNGVCFSINVLFLSIIFSCFINWIFFICSLGRFLDSYQEAVNVFDSSAWHQTCSWVVLKKCRQLDLIIGMCHVFIHIIHYSLFVSLPGTALCLLL